MRISFSACKQTPAPMVNFPGGLINILPPLQWRKEKAVVVMGATGTGKSRLSIELAKRFDAEVINSDKMQVYRGLDIITNKVTEEECGDVPHHLLGFVDPAADFSAHDFVCHAAAAADAIASKGRMPIIAGGSNSFIKALFCDDVYFRSRYECCFLWVDAAAPLLNSFVSRRVDKMVDSGLVAEAREFFDPSGDYGRGIRRAIGVPELDAYFRGGGSAAAREKLLRHGIEQIKANTRTLACRQVQNIMGVAKYLLDRRIHRLDATEVFLKHGEDSAEAWERLVAGPSTRIIAEFLCEDRRRMDFVSAIGPPHSSASVIMGPASATVAAATH